MTKEEKAKIDAYLKHKFRLSWRFYSNARKTCIKAAVCAVCRKNKRPLYADHIEAVINPKTGFRGWDEYYNRMFNGKLQALCRDCHKAKTKKENAERRKTRVETGR